MLILPKERYMEMTEKIREIQKLYPLKKWQLADAYSKLERWVEDNSRTIYPEDLGEGQAYGMLYYSHDAFAYDHKTRDWLRNHGDIYSGLWIWNADKSLFWCENAWGQVYEKKLSTVHQPLIEFP